MPDGADGRVPQRCISLLLPRTHQALAAVGRAQDAVDHGAAIAAGVRVHQLALGLLLAQIRLRVRVQAAAADVLRAAQRCMQRRRGPQVRRSLWPCMTRQMLEEATDSPCRRTWRAEILLLSSSSSVCWVAAAAAILHYAAWMNVQLVKMVDKTSLDF